KDSMTGYGDEPEVPLDPCFSFPCPVGQSCVQDANGARCEPNKPALHCTANETVSDCGALCEGKCSQLGKGPFACPEICLPPACACSPGKYRNDAGLCVASRDCPLKCDENEQVDECGNRCEPTCENAYGKVKVCVLICDPPACVCKPNYYRKNGKCVPQRDCPFSKQ
ncbi:trypsin Inhibitor like cysteine rich domain protein, partial [Ancylostoma duodenale]